jgi:transcriptional regulator with XRE-family HTH domain
MPETTLTIPVHLGQCLGRIRAARGVTQQDVAVALHVSPSLVCLWDSGKRHPRLRHAARYARFLNHRLVAIRDGRVVAKGIGLANITRLRTAVGATPKELARRACVDVSRVQAVERCASPGMGVCTCQRYLGALGYQVGLVLAA